MTLVRKTMAKNKLSGLMDAIAAKTLLIAPVDAGETTAFRPVKSASEAAMNLPNTMIPPKGHFFPQHETLFSYKTGGASWELEPEDGSVRERVLFGVRPCDLQSLHMLDYVFDGTFKDDYYLAKRAATTVVGMACENPRPSCFCTSFGYGPGSGEGSDVFLMDIGEKFLVSALTEKGEKLLETFPAFFDNAGEAEVSAAESKADELAGKVTLKVNIERIERTLRDNFDSPYWSRMSRKCLLCGACTYLCPTCHCFDIHDMPTSPEGDGIRFRCWDSCMFRGFTQAAGGHNPRPTKTERVRQRFMHKLSYFKDRYGEQLCVGCGRCVEKCPVNLDITKVIEDANQMARASEVAESA